jgi:hypothetical protein
MRKCEARECQADATHFIYCAGKRIYLCSNHGRFFDASGLIKMTEANKEPDRCCICDKIKLTDAEWDELEQKIEAVSQADRQIDGGEFSKSFDYYEDYCVCEVKYAERYYP